MALSDEAAPEKIAKRLTLVREVSGLSQIAFARRAEIGQSAWNNYECGRKRIGLDAAMRLCEAYGLTLDYIYLGDASNLPYKLASAIEAVRSARG